MGSAGLVGFGGMGWWVCCEEERRQFCTRAVSEVRHESSTELASLNLPIQTTVEPRRCKSWL